MNNNLITGITDFLVLYILSENGDSYVYEICKMIETNSNHLLNISHNTIYTVVYKLENDGKISEYSQRVGKKRTRIYYHIEPSGLEYLDKLKDDYNSLTQGIAQLFKNLKTREENE